MLLLLPMLLKLFKNGHILCAECVLLLLFCLCFDSIAGLRLLQFVRLLLSYSSVLFALRTSLARYNVCGVLRTSSGAYFVFRFKHLCCSWCCCSNSTCTSRLWGRASEKRRPKEEPRGEEGESGAKEFSSMWNFCLPFAYTKTMHTEERRSMFFCCFFSVSFIKNTKCYNKMKIPRMNALKERCVDVRSWGDGNKREREIERARERRMERGRERKRKKDTKPHSIMPHAT